jgi:competence protein ComEC
LLSAGRHLELEKGVDLDILWPPAGRDLEPNDSCLVLRLAYAGRSILFPADIQDIAEGELLADPAKLLCDVLIAPHHGSATATTADFLAAAQPRLVLASNGHTLSQKQRDFDALAAGIPLYRTHNSGAIVLTIGRNGRMKMETFLQRPHDGQARSP